MYIYQFDPPVTDSFASFRVKDFDSISDGTTITSWGTADVDSGSPIYKNDSSFPYINLNGGHLETNQYNVQPSMGFTFTGLVYTKDVTSIYPFTWTYVSLANNGIRLYRTGGGERLVFRAQNAGNAEVEDSNATTTNTWQVHTCRITDNGDSTVTMEFLIDNVIKGSGTFASSILSGIVDGYIGIGNSTVWGNGSVTPAPINVSDWFFFDRSLSSTELQQMYTYLTTLGDPYVIPPLTLQPKVGRINVTLGEVSGAQKYRLELTNNASSDVIFNNIPSFVEQFSTVFSDLSANTPYTIALYADLGSGYVQQDSQNLQTLENVPANYDPSDYGGNGSYDLSALGQGEFGLINEVLNNLFNTGEKINIKLATGLNLDTSFVNLGDTVPTSENVLVPFNTSLGSGQAFTLQLEDTSTISVAYDETNNSVSIGGENVNVGGTIVVDGMKCTVKDI